MLNISDRNYARRLSCVYLFITAILFTVPVHATTGLSPNTPFEIDGNPESTSGVEFDFLVQAMPGTLGGYGSGIFNGTPYSGTDDGSFIQIDGGDGSCNTVLAQFGGNIADTNTVGSQAVNFNDSPWPAPQTGATPDKTEICAILVATETIQNGTEYENILYFGLYYMASVGSDRGFSLPLFANPFGGSAPQAGDCSIDFDFGQNNTTAEYICYDGSGWNVVGAVSSAAECVANVPDGFLECAINLDQLGLFTQDSCEVVTIGAAVSRSSGGSFSSQIKDYVVIDSPIVIENCGAIGVSKVTDYVFQDPDPLLPPENFSYTFENLDSSVVHDDTLITLANDEQPGNTIVGDTFENVPLPGTSAEQLWENVIASPDFTITETVIPSPWKLSSIECTYTDIFDNDAVKTATLVANGAPGPDAATGVPVPPYAAAKTSCVITNIDDTTTPVTLSAASSEMINGSLKVDWSTSSELFNVGFQLWGLDGSDQKWEKLHNWLLRSGSGNAVEPQSYSKTVKIPGSVDELVAVGISSVDSDGTEHYYGPFEIGRSYGSLSQLKPISWDHIRTELDRSMASKGYVKDRVNGYRKVAGMTSAEAAEMVVDITISKDGIYRVDAGDLLQAGLDLSETAKRAIAVVDNTGRPVVRYVLARGSGSGGNKTLGSNGEIYFYGRTPSNNAALYSTSGHYRILIDPMQALAAPVQGKQGISSGFSTHYREQLILETDRHYSLSAQADDPWLNAEYVSFSSRSSMFSDTLTLPDGVILDEPMIYLAGLGRGSALVSIDTNADGVQDPEHLLTPAVYGDSGEVVWQNQLSEVGKGPWSVSVPLSATPGDIYPDTPAIDVLLGGALNAGLGYDFSVIQLDFLGLEYARTYTPKQGQDFLSFTPPNDGETGYDVIIPDKGWVLAFAHEHGNLVRILPEMQTTLTDASGNRQRRVQVAALNGAGSSNGALSYWISGKRGYLSADSISAKARPGKTNLLDQAQGANYLIIAHSAFTGAVLDGYAAHKQGQGYSVAIVDYLSIVDAFGGGQPGPHGLTRFLAETEARGGIDHVLLIGGSVYDHLDRLHTGALTFIPGHYAQSEHSRFTVSDVPYVMDVEQNLFATIGRWPVRSQADLAAITAKSVAWSARDHSDGAVLMIAEQTVAGESIDFAGALAQQIEPLIPSQWDTNTVSVDEILSNNPGYTLNEALNTAKSRIIGHLNDTPQVVLYNGHATTSQLSNKGLFRASEVSSVTADGAELWVPMSCYVTFYESTHVNTLAHQLMFEGNAVNITGAMLLSNQGTNIAAGRSIVDEVLNNSRSVGEAVNRYKASKKDAKFTINWALLGDPTLGKR